MERQLLGVRIHALSMKQSLDLVGRAISTRCQLHIGVVNAAKLVNMRRNTELREAVLTSDVILADGMSVVYASRLLGKALPERVTGIDLMHGMLRHGQERGYRIYCLGAREDALHRAVETIRRDYPGILIVGMRNGYFGPDEERDVAGEIRAAAPDILFVAMSPPKKEIFLAKWAAKMSVPVCHGVGGAFDVLAGKVRRAPEAWQRYGLEWLYRVVQEPRRMWKRYLVTNTLFLSLVLRELVLGPKGLPDGK